MFKKIYFFFFLFAATSSFAGVIFSIPSNNRITHMRVQMIVPPKPAAAEGTLFLWPGLQPGGANYFPINNGVLQSVLTWGPSCAPTNQPPLYSTWWISAQYVNTYGSDPGYTGCLSGPAMSVHPGDVLTITFSLSNEVWTQTIYDHNTEKKVEFQINMMNQAQNYAIFSIEPYNNAILGHSLYFHNIVMDFADELPSGPSIRGDSNAHVSTPILSNNNKKCTISEIILQQQ